MEAFRFLANTCVALDAIPKRSPLNTRLNEFKAILQTHAATTQHKLRDHGQSDRAPGVFHTHTPSSPLYLCR